MANNAEVKPASRSGSRPGSTNVTTGSGSGWGNPAGQNIPRPVQNNINERNDVNINDDTTNLSAFGRRNNNNNKTGTTRPGSASGSGWNMPGSHNHTTNHSTQVGSGQNSMTNSWSHPSGYQNNNAEDNLPDFDEMKRVIQKAVEDKDLPQSAISEKIFADENVPILYKLNKIGFG